MDDHRRLTYLLLIGVIILPAAEAQGSARPIRILSIGAVLPGDTPIVEILSPEPGVEQTLVPTRRASEMDPKTARRYVRLYFPKTYDWLKEYDFIMYVAAPDVRPLTTNQIRQLRKATEEGTPAFADQGGISGYEAFEEAWIASGLHEIFPNDAAAVLLHGVAHSLGISTFRISIKDGNLPPVIKPFSDLGIERYVVSHGFYVVPKLGSTIWAEMKGLFPEKGMSFPWLMSLEYAQGLTWNLGDNFISTFWGSRFGNMRNPYRTDILMNVIYYSLRRELPEDILLVHNQREAFSQYLQQRRFLLELIDFAESFGANVARLYDGLGEADLMLDGARNSYMEQDYDATQERMADAFETISILNSQAVRAKDRAMMWVFASEWMALTATSIVAAWILHFLMIRRGLYLEPGRTSFR